DPKRWDGRLLPFQVSDLPKVMPEILRRKRRTKTVTMAKAALNNGQVLYAVNDLFIGPKSHTSARYVIRIGPASETHSSSGVVVSTGMGSTGWLTSLLTGAAAITQSVASTAISRGANTKTASPAGTHKTPANGKSSAGIETAFSWDANYLCYTVREPFPT